MHLNYGNCFKGFKRLGKKGSNHRKILASVNSYDTNLQVLNCHKNCDEYEHSGFNLFEKVQIQFFKFVLNINRYASYHAIRAELGKFQLYIESDTKLIKYWHHLETLDSSNVILKEVLMFVNKIIINGILI